MWVCSSEIIDTAASSKHQWFHHGLLSSRGYIFIPSPFLLILSGRQFNGSNSSSLGNPRQNPTSSSSSRCLRSPNNEPLFLRSLSNTVYPAAVTHSNARWLTSSLTHFVTSRGESNLRCQETVNGDLCNRPQERHYLVRNMERSGVMNLHGVTTYLRLMEMLPGVAVPPNPRAAWWHISFFTIPVPDFLHFLCYIDEHDLIALHNAVSPNFAISYHESHLSCKGALVTLMHASQVHLAEHSTENTAMKPTIFLNAAGTFRSFQLVGQIIRYSRNWCYSICFLLRLRDGRSQMRDLFQLGTRRIHQSRCITLGTYLWQLVEYAEGSQRIR